MPSSSGIVQKFNILAQDFTKMLLASGHGRYCIFLGEGGGGHVNPPENFSYAFARVSIASKHRPLRALKGERHQTSPERCVTSWIAARPHICSVDKSVTSHCHTREKRGMTLTPGKVHGMLLSRTSSPQSRPHAHLRWNWRVDLSI